MLLRQVMADHAAADRANQSVMAGIVPGDAAYNRALQTTSGVRCPHGRQYERRTNDAEFVCSLHVVTSSGEVDACLPDLEATFWISTGMRYDDDCVASAEGRCAAVYNCDARFVTADYKPVAAAARRHHAATFALIVLFATGAYDGWRGVNSAVNLIGSIFGRYCY
jgi:hypothetical protein